MVHQESRLYESPCPTRQQVTNWLVTVAGTKRLFNPSGDTNALNERMAEVNLAANDFRVCAGRVLMKQQDDILQIQGWMSLQQGQLTRSIEGISNNVQRLAQHSTAQQLIERSAVFGILQAAANESIQPVLEGVMQSEGPDPVRYIG